MSIELNCTAKDKEAIATPIGLTQRKSRISLIDLNILLGLTFAALLPRVMLALQLDMVTDEPVYIDAGKIYFPLLKHLKIGVSGWDVNYEHPPLIKLFIGLTLYLNTLLAHPLAELLAARIPSIIMGTLLVVAIYWLGRAPVGRVVALVAALCLAFSPWLAFFSAIAYLDIPMTALITIAYLLLWHALQRPALYLLSAVMVGLAAASKYPAVLAVPGMILFTVYYFFLIRPRLPVEQRSSSRIPWGWWIGSIILAPLTFLAADPAIWPSPYSLLIHSFTFEWNHATQGHPTFMAGQFSTHATHWAIFYILLTKISIFVIVFALFFACYALVQLIRFHLHTPSIQISDVTLLSFILLWLIGIIGMFSLFTIVVGTHYELPAAPPVALAGAYGLAILLRYRRGQLFSLPTSEPAFQEEIQAQTTHSLSKSKLNFGDVAKVIVLTTALTVPHFIGLVSIPDAEGYSSELFHGENAALQVAYPGYRDALQWLSEHTHGTASVGIVTLSLVPMNPQNTSWYSYNKDFIARYHLVAVFPNTKIPAYDYLIFPMDLIQRDMTIPAPWKYHIIHTVSGGNTTYCYITAYASSTAITGRK
jgi:4-amino-4-deoxy-L-arabinose transferase-like glycosyltransferase